MSYVDAGYTIALAVLCVYAISLVLRRRRWERAARNSQGSQGSPAEPVAPGGRL